MQAVIRSEALDDDVCWRAVTSRDSRFDGRFVTAVRTTGIYCRPSCAAQTPRRHNIGFYRHPAAAVAAGFRACKRCRPDAAPGTRDWDARGDLAARALRAIAAGAVDDVGIPGLAADLHVSERHLHRVLVAEVGAGPLALARTRRAQTARLLLAATDLPATRIAFAAGFGSIRQFNDTMREQFGCPPARLRRPAATVPGAGSITLRVPHRAPYDATATLDWLRLHAVSGVEEVTASGYRRVLRDGTKVDLRPVPDGTAWSLTLAVDDLAGLTAVVAGCRRILDSDADPDAIAAALCRDPLLVPLVRQRPGLRAPGSADPFEQAVRTVIGQQVSLAAARTFTGRLVTLLGEPLTEPADGLTHRFPSAEVVADWLNRQTRDSGLRDSAKGIGLTADRERTLHALAAAVAERRLRLDPVADHEEAIRGLLALPGIGPWTASIVALRGLGDPDAWPGSDLVLRRRVEAGGADPEQWRPWRGYAAMHLWVDWLTTTGAMR